VCVDVGATFVSGIHASTVSRLRAALLGEPGYRVKITHLLQLNGEIDEKLRSALPVDVAGVAGPTNVFGFPNDSWKPWQLFDGTPVLVPGGFNPTVDSEGNLLMYPKGDHSYPPSALMPQGGFYFDPIIRQDPINEAALDPADNCEEFSLIGETDLAEFAAQTAQLATKTSYGIFGTPPGIWGLGDAMLVPAVGLPHPRGIRDPEEWYISLVARPDYVQAVFEYQTQLMIENIHRLADLVGDQLQVVRICGTDFGGQAGMLISLPTYREVFSPYYRRVNAAVHELTGWKTFKHCDGSIVDLIPDLVEDGFDVLNPVQTSTARMDPRLLKREFGDRIVFWGAGVETQTTLPFGTPDEVYREVRERIDIFNDGGGFVLAAIHNIQPGIPVPNLMAMFQAIRDSWAES
jgi:hypothetical protein